MPRPIITTFTAFSAVLESLAGRMVPFKGQYQKSLTSASFDLHVTGASYDPSSRKVLFDCDLSSMNGKLEGRRFAVQFTHDGICSNTPDKETQAYLDRDGSGELAKELERLCGQITVGGK